MLGNPCWPGQLLDAAVSLFTEGLFTEVRLVCLAVCGFATSGLSRRERGEAAIDVVNVELLWVEVAAAPFEQFRVTLVLWVRDGFQELAIAPRTADIFGRAAATGAFDETRIDDAGDNRPSP